MRAPKLKSVAQKKINPEMLKKSKASEEKPKKVNNKESGAPKRPVSAFLIFMQEFRKSFKENFPDNKCIATVGKAGGEKWKSLSEKDKAPYVEKAKLKKVDYEKALEEFKQKKAGNPVVVEKSEGSEKSSSDTHEEVFSS
ncbi:hypothetical protein V2J09_009018 [Rumex salicifolius]